MESQRFTCKSHIFGVEPRGLEPLASAVQRRLDSLPEVSSACKIPANQLISALVLFSAFQEIYSGCCTVAAHAVLSTSATQMATRVLSMVVLFG